MVFLFFQDFYKPEYTLQSLVYLDLKLGLRSGEKNTGSRRVTARG